MAIRQIKFRNYSIILISHDCVCKITRLILKLSVDADDTSTVGNSAGYHEDVMRMTIMGSATMGTGYGLV